MASNNSTGAKIQSGSLATIRGSTFDENNIGIDASGTALTDIIIKDTLVIHSSLNGINDNGTPILILDTRSYNSGADSLSAATLSSASYVLGMCSTLFIQPKLQVRELTHD